MLLKLQIISLLLTGVQSMDPINYFKEREKAKWSEHVVLIFYNDLFYSKKGVAPPLEYFHETIPDCLGTMVTNNHVLTGATCVANYKMYDELGIKKWTVVKVFFVFDRSTCSKRSKESLFSAKKENFLVPFTQF